MTQMYFFIVDTTSDLDFSAPTPVNKALSMQKQQDCIKYCINLKEVEEL